MTYHRSINLYRPQFFLKTTVQLAVRCLSQRHGIILLIMAHFAGLTSGSAMAADTLGVTRYLGPKFFNAQQRDQAIQSRNTEEASIVWEIDGDAYCSHTPPSGVVNGFQFNEGDRWSASATNAGPLAQGDPMTLTWSFVADGPQGSGFNCFVTGETAGADSDLIAFLDNIHGAGPGGADLTLRPWFSIFESAFDNWGILNGINYVYEPNDDGAAAGGGGALGVLGVRGDIRIGGHFIDGQVGSNVLACNYFANSGDMIIDTGNTNFYSPAPPEHRAFRNVLEHEHGHGLSISHVCPINQTKLMEPFISTAFLGAQEDDILAANRGYGDRDEFSAQNDTSLTATSLGVIPNGGTANRTQLSIDGSSDQDFYSFVAPQNSEVSVTLTPTGSTYLEGLQFSNGSCSAGVNFNSLIENNLGFELRGRSGSNVLASANSTPAGNQEAINNISLTEGTGTYFVRVFGTQNKAQMYDLTVRFSANGETDEGCSNFVIKTIDGDAVVFCL